MMFSSRALKTIFAACMLALVAQAHVGKYDIDAEPVQDGTAPG